MTVTVVANQPLPERREARRRAIPRVVFYGRTNASGQPGVLNVVQQFRHCLETVHVRGVITRAYYDLPGVQQHNDHARPLVEAVRELGGPADRAGGWAALLDALAKSDPDFDVLVAQAPDRLPRRTSSIMDFGRQAVPRGVTVHFALDGPMPVKARCAGWSYDRWLQFGILRTPRPPSPDSRGR